MCKLGSIECSKLIQFPHISTLYNELCIQYLGNLLFFFVNLSGEVEMSNAKDFACIFGMNGKFFCGIRREVISSIPDRI